MESAPPSGEQIGIEHGDQRVWIVEVGGGIRRYTVGDRDLLDGYGSDELCTGGRGQLLMPWPNRVRDGSYQFGGGTHQLALSEPPARNAIHGLIRWASWRIAERSGDRVTMAHSLHPQPGYPYDLDLSVEYSLGPDGLTVTTRATNVGQARCPFGSGAHPYLRAGPGTIDGARLQAPGRTWLPSDERGIPTGAESVTGTRYDFAQARKLEGTKLDTAFTDLDRDDQGRAWVTLQEAGGSGSVALWADEHHRYLMLFTGDSLPDRAQRRHGLATEPMTCAPNAFQSGDGLLVLEPSESFVCSWGITSP